MSSLEISIALAPGAFAEPDASDGDVKRILEQLAACCGIERAVVRRSGTKAWHVYDQDHAALLGNARIM